MLWRYHGGTRALTAASRRRRPFGAALKTPAQGSILLALASQGWNNAKPVEGEDALTVGGYKIKSKQQGYGSKPLWLHVQLPNGTWAYHVLDGENGSHLCQALGRTKREAYRAAAEALRPGPDAAPPRSE